jgi:ribosome-binding factor A
LTGLSTGRREGRVPARAWESVQDFFSFFFSVAWARLVEPAGREGTPFFMSSKNRRTPERASARDAFRRERLERLVLDELRSTLRDDVRQPGLAGVALLRLDLAPDGSHARVAYAGRAEPGEEEAAVGRRTQAALEAATGYLRSRLATSLDLKRLPKLGFTFVGVALDDSMPKEKEEEAGPCLD